MGTKSIEPIGEADLDRVGDFLHKNLNNRISAEDWAREIKPPWPVQSPNHGFMLLDDGEVVGAYLAFYSEREIDGQSLRFCNLAAWCVLPDYRLHAVKLLTKLLRQPGYHFTDLSPSGNVIAINERLNLTHLDTTTALMPNLPWPSLPGRTTVTEEPDVVESVLTEAELKLYRDHLGACAALQLVIIDGDEHCYVVFRRDRRKDLPLFASVLYVSNRALFVKRARAFGRHLLLRHGIPFTLLELRVVGAQPALSLRMSSSRVKMCKSDSLQPHQIDDDLYSELACVAW